MVQSVLDLFPDQDSVLIRKYLKYYKNDVEQLINALLENNLPPILVDEASRPTQTNHKRIEAFIDELDDVNDIDIGRLKLQVNFNELSNRRNVFDGDDFDIFQKENVDMSRIHQGKK